VLDARELVQASKNARCRQPSRRLGIVSKTVYSTKSDELLGYAGPQMFAVHFGEGAGR